MNKIAATLAILAALLMAASSTLFVVDQRQVGVIYALGEIKEVVTEPGLNFKLPPPFQNVVFLDRRVQTLDSPETRPIFTAEKKSLIVDWLIKWRIAEPRQFIRNNGVDFRNLEARLAPVVQAAFNEEITKRDVKGVLATERDKVMNDVKARLADDAKSFGIEILDVRIKRADLPQANSQSVYNRMKTDREREAGQLRAEGDEENARIKATADREVAVIKADAGLKGQILKGEADAAATEIYAKAFSKDKDFYGFYRRMEAYKQAFGSGGSTMLLSPDNDFFRYFNDPSGIPALKK